MEQQKFITTSSKVLAQMVIDRERNRYFAPYIGSESIKTEIEKLRYQLINIAAKCLRAEVESGGEIKLFDDVLEMMFEVKDEMLKQIWKGVSNGNKS